MVTCKEFTVFIYDKFNLNNNILTQKVPIHGMLFVTIVTTEANSPGFLCLKKEYSFVYASVHFDLFFSNSA